MGRKNLGDRHAGMRRLDLGVGIHEMQIQPRREPPPDGGLARAHHADQHDRAPPSAGRDGASWGSAGARHRTRSQTSNQTSNCRRTAACRATYTTPVDVARDCSAGEHGGSLDRYSRVPMVNIAARGRMPTLIRFLTVVAVIGGSIYGGIFALANFFDPKPREITVTIPPDKFQNRR